MLIRLIYASEAGSDFRPSQLARLLRDARDKNARLNISGMLLFSPGYFVQLLEGEPGTVDALYARIRLDPRHHRVLTLDRASISQRAFGDWSMGLLTVDGQADSELRSLGDFMRGGVAALEADPALAARLVEELTDGSHRNRLE